MIAPAGVARGGPPLAPVLGQAGIKVTEFTTEWNARTSTWVEGLPLGGVVRKVPGRWTLTVGVPTWGVLRGGIHHRGDLWTALVVRLGRPPTPGEVRTALGVLRCGGHPLRG